MLQLLPFLGLAAASTPSVAACEIAWRSPVLTIRCDRPVQVVQSSLRGPERRIIDIKNADLLDPRTPGRLAIGQAGVRQVRIARYPLTHALRVVLDLDGDAVLRTDIEREGRVFLARLAGGFAIGEPAEPSFDGLGLSGPPAPKRSHGVGAARRYGMPSVPLAMASPRPSPTPAASPVPPAKPMTVDLPRPAPDEIGEPGATRSIAWPASPQVVEAIRIRKLNSGDTTIEVRGREALMAWVQEEVAPRRLTIRVPRASLACDAPVARGAVSRVLLRRETDSWVLALDLAEARHLFDSELSDDRKTLKIRIRKAHDLVADKPVVLVDPGHGGYDPGAAGPGTLTESQVALAVGRQVARYLEILGYQAVLTRTMDAELQLPNRALLLERYNPVAFVSLHCNSSDSPEAAGIETYYRHASGHTLARAIHDKLVAATGAADRGLRTASLFVLRGERIPATLVEMGFISSPKEGERLADLEYQAVAGRAIAEGVKAFVERREPPVVDVGVLVSGN
jgi:N-acetylmuramoyl-L-alanine amidase